MRIKNPEIRQKQWNKVLAHLYYIDHPQEFKKPFADEHKDIIEFIENDIIEVHPRCMDPLCSKVSTFLVLHHRDGNVYNDGIENIKILCKSCNAKARNWGIHGGSKLGKKHEKHSLKEKEKRQDYELENGRPIVRYYESMKKLESEPKFISFLETLLENIQQVTGISQREVELKAIILKNAIDAMANETSTDQQTVIRFINRKTNPINGIYEVFEDERVKMIRRRKK